MKLIINIPDDIYNRLQTDFVSAGNTFYDTALNSIINGTPMYKNCSKCAYQDTPLYFCRDCQIIVHRHFKENKE